MQIECFIDNTRTVKTGMKITLTLDESATEKFLPHLYNFAKKPLKVDFQVDAAEAKAMLDRITEEQRKKIYALFKDVADFTGDSPEAMKYNLKYLFRQAYEYPDFSLSDCEKGMASEFITYIIAWCLAQSVSLSQKPLEIVDDVQAYLYVCIQYKKCCICGKEAQVHHVDAIGMGRNRRTHDDSQHKKIALCPTCHGEAHQIGWDTFAEKWHVEGVVVK